MKRLPVPQLDETLERYLEALGPLQGAGEHAVTQRAVAEFVDGDGPACQAALLRLAHDEDRAGGSWLGSLWLDSYLTTREPLPLASNVVFQLAWPAGPRGVDLAADLAHRVAAVHLTHLRGEAGADVNPRGEELTPTQWRFLAGGIRRPRPGTDVYEDGPASPATRHIVVLRHGHAHGLTISDAEGSPLPRPALAASLARIIEVTPAGTGRFADSSYLGAEAGARVLDPLLVDPGGAVVHDTLRAALFVLDLVDEPTVDGPAAALGLLLTDVGHAWVRKPASYQVGLRDGFVGVHFEHSVADGATLRDLVVRARAVTPRDDAADPPEAWPLAWPMSDGLAGQVERDLRGYRNDADRLRVRLVTVPFEIPDGRRLSHDAAMQWLLAYAQLATRGRAGSTYEAVDMREYRAGRTECLRPLTAAALTLASGLLDGTATPEDLEAARAGHSSAVKACKRGDGIDRHLFGLRAMADRLGLRPAIFTDDGYRRLTSDALSTTSLGGPETIVRLTFAPTSAGGIGVNYTVDEGHYEFCLSWSARERADIEDFAAALHRGAAALEALVRGAGSRLSSS